MQNTYIPGLDVFNTSDNDKDCEKGYEIDLPMLRTKFRIRESCDSRFIQQFQKQKCMIDGHFENFYECYDDINKRPVTLVRYKKLKPLDEEFKDSLREHEIVRNLQHFNILQFCETASSNWTCVFWVFEPCRCFLSDLLKAEIEKLHQLSVIKIIMLQLFQALDYLHKNSIMHRNIHPESIAIDDSGYIKVCNFRNARLLWDEDISIQSDEVRYRSPELLMGTKICGKPVDIWSAACLLAHLLLLRPLFPLNDPRHTLLEIFSIFGFPTKECWPEFFKLPEFSFLVYDEGKIHSYNYLDQYFKKCECLQSRSTMDLLQSMFYLNPENRLSAKDCSVHPFFSEDPKASTLDDLILCVNLGLSKQDHQKSMNEMKS